ncbi:MAG: acyltransferase [Lachnospiraceae bacterium]|nr:acyltransferase [Lachnospiraceae bacterium]
MHVNAKKSRLRSIQVLRILCTLGVVTGHFFLEYRTRVTDMSTFPYMTGFFAKSPLVYAFNGDFAVVLFWVMAGLLVGVGLSDKTDRKGSYYAGFIAKRELGVIIPPALYLVIEGLILHFVNRSYGIRDIFEAEKAMIRGTTPASSYQLWYIGSVIAGYLVCTALAAFTSSNMKTMIIASVCIMIYARLIPNQQSLFCMTAGCLAGVCAVNTVKARLANGRSETERDTINAVFMLTGLLVFIVSPFMGDNPNVPTQAMMIGVMLAIAVYFIVVYEMSTRKQTPTEAGTEKADDKAKKQISIATVLVKIADFLDRVSFTVYIVHVGILKAFMDLLPEGALTPETKALFFPIALILIVAAAFIYDLIVMVPMRKIMKLMEGKENG